MELTGFHNGYEWVDLGLPSGLLWATCNVGASKPEEYGERYSWGGKENGSDSDYYTGYNDLPISRDTARNKMGGKWRMPSKVEFNELISNCTCLRTSQSGTTGYLCTSKLNSKQIFFTCRASSYTDYWSSSFDRVNLARVLRFELDRLYESNSGLSACDPVRAVLSRSDL